MVLKDFSAGGIFKLAPTGYMAAVLRDGKPHTNAGRMSCEVVISTQDEDRSGDVVVTKGIDLADHKRNPVALLNHDKDAPIGLFEDRLGNYTVKLRGDNTLVGEIFFHQNSELACDVFRAIENKVFRGVSIGFMPIGGKIEKRATRGHVYHASKMVEGSVLTLGDNQNAIIEAVHKGFGGKALCAPLLAILRQQVPERPASVVSGWDMPDFLVKGSTYKMAEARECAPMSRSAVYYICPHCDAEMTDESIYTESDGTTRHGPCRGAVVINKPEPGQVPLMDGQSEKVVTPTVADPIITEAKPKGIKLTPRFLPGIRRKAMDDFNAGGGEDEFMPVDDAGGDGAGGAMKAGAEFMHGVNDILMQLFQFIEDGKGSIDNPTAMKVADKVSGIASKAKAALHAGYGGYKSEHPDQPDLVGGDDGGMEEFGDEGDDLDDDDLDLEDDADPTDEDGDEKPKKKPKKKKSDSDNFSKAASEWRCKALNGYWEHVKRQASIGDVPTVKSALATLAAIRDDRSVPRGQRLAAKAEAKALGALLVTKEAKPAEVETVDEWEAFLTN